MLLYFFSKRLVIVFLLHSKRGLDVCQDGRRWTESALLAHTDLGFVRVFVLRRHPVRMGLAGVRAQERRLLQLPVCEQYSQRDRYERYNAHMRLHCRAAWAITWCVSVLDCSEQDEQLSIIFTIASFMNNFFALPNGFVFDRFGTTVTRLLGMWVLNSIFKQMFPFWIIRHLMWRTLSRRILTCAVKTPAGMILFKLRQSRVKKNGSEFISDVHVRRILDSEWSV